MAHLWQQRISALKKNVLPFFLKIRYIIHQLDGFIVFNTGLDQKMQKNQKNLDKIDTQILKELQSDGRMSNVELSRRVNLSPTPCLERVRRLEQNGYITGYMAIIDPRKLNQSLVVFVEITLDRTTPDVFDVFAAAIRKLPEIEECHMVAGGFDYLAKLRVEDMYAYREFLERLSSVQGVSQTHTYVVMEEVKVRPGISIP